LDLECLAGDLFKDMALLLKESTIIDTKGRERRERKERRREGEGRERKEEEKGRGER
jgi:hypothetical protein